MRSQYAEGEFCIHMSYECIHKLKGKLSYLFYLDHRSLGFDMSYSLE